MVEGRLNKQIAYLLGLSEKTVKMHRARLLKALNVHSSAEAIRIAVEASFACWQPPSLGELFIGSPRSGFVNSTLGKVPAVRTRHSLESATGVKRKYRFCALTLELPV